MTTCGVCTQRCLKEQVTKLPRHVVGGGSYKLCECLGSGSYRLCDLSKLLCLSEPICLEESLPAARRPGLCSVRWSQVFPGHPGVSSSLGWVVPMAESDILAILTGGRGCGASLAGAQTGLCGHAPPLFSGVTHPATVFFELSCLF